MNSMADGDPFNLFLPPVRTWFQKALGEPTPAQRLGWPAIAAGQHTLLLAPTGSGKTLAAFLACLDALWRQSEIERRVHVLYVSPLKALNNDIHRNLQVPLEGVADTARLLDFPLPTIEVAVRTGDTTTAERQRQLRRPPHVLITTPESLHLLLTSRGREMLGGLSHVIVDEIHALCTNKRGVFLSLLLERLEALQAGRAAAVAPQGTSLAGARPPGTFVRIGLSATQRPLEEVARFLGGAEIDAAGVLRPRPVTILDAGRRKDLDLQVVSPVEQFGLLPEGSIWPPIYRLLTSLVRAHRSTIIFANNRRTVERITANLNEENNESDEAGADAPTPTADNSSLLARAHHGSIALEVRQQIESALKEGRLPAVVATASLELGIDMGAVDLVCQVESPGNVARALQRVGRAGHLVGQRSKGRLIPKTLPDLLEEAVLAREMAAGRVEESRVPINCLDILAQQVVAMAAMEPWDVSKLYMLVRRAYPFRDLTAQAFEATLEMVSGRYVWANPPTEPDRQRGNETGTGPRRPGTLQALQPRVSWDRIHNRVLALPGSQQLALVNGGSIPDTGQYGAYVGDVRIGELDEEFVYECRLGHVFLLGTNAWRIEKIEADRVLVSPAEGAPAIVPFWRGENAGRSYELGQALGEFLRTLRDHLDDSDPIDWLKREYFLDDDAARNLSFHVKRQLASTGSLPTDRTLCIEASRDQLGDWQVILLSPLGARLHFALRLALEARLRQRLGYHPQCLHHSDGILIRLTDSDEPIVDLFDGLTPENVESLILGELGESALFAIRFRQNAARALLMPRGQPGKRSPLWLQRLRGKDLLQVARRHPDFPIVVETFRECLHDHLDVPRLQELLSDIRAGRIEVVTRRAESPSPFASTLLFSFTAAQMYVYDGVEAGTGQTGHLDRQLLEQLVSPGQQKHLLDPRAVNQVEKRLRGIGQPPRTATETAEWLRRLGDLAETDLEGPMLDFLAELEADGRAKRIEIPRTLAPQRWVATENVAQYRRAFGLEDCTPADAQAAGAAILERFLTTHALVGLADVLARYPFERGWAERQLEEWSRSGRAVAIQHNAEPLQWSAPENLEQVQRGTLAVLRREIVTCSPPQFADFLLRWQGVHPATRGGTSAGIAAALERLEGLPLPGDLWEQTVLPARVAGYQPRWLDEWSAGGAGVWVGQGDGDGTPNIAFFRRESLARLPAPARNDDALPADAAAVLGILQSRGAMFLADIASADDLSPSAVRAGLWSLVRRGLATNDHFDVIRRGAEEMPAPNGEPGFERAIRGHSSQRISMRTLRRRAAERPEGRWSLLTWGRPETEAQAVFQATLLLNRYGIVARELALMDPWLLPWRVLYEVLSRMEMAGEVRRGYFVEGLSGAQFALSEAGQRLQDLHLPSTAAAPIILLHSMDPANLYGSGAPFDIPLLDGGTRPLLRRPGNWLVLRAGRPILLAEQQGNKITALASASRDDIVAAAAVLPGMLDHGRSMRNRHKLTVEEWNGQPVTATEGKELLEAAGFVRDYQGMTLYAAWR